MNFTVSFIFLILSFLISNVININIKGGGWLLGDCGAEHQLCSDGRTCCELGDTCCPDSNTNTGTGCCDIDNAVCCQGYCCFQGFSCIKGGCGVKSDTSQVLWIEGRPINNGSSVPPPS